MKRTMLKKFIIIAAFLSGIAVTADSQSVSGLPRSTPSAEGVSSELIVKFIDEIERTKEENKQYHSIMILKNGKVITEAWWEPYVAQWPHTMYSITKSFTASAIGFAIDEGLLKVSDKLVSFFPDNLPDSMDTRMSEITVEHLLSMSSGINESDIYSSPNLDQSNVVKSILSVPVKFEPGTVFQYNSMGSHMLSEIINKVTGQDIKEYLKPRLFEPLGMRYLEWGKINGVSAGGYGLNLKTEDMAKFGQLFLNDGVWNGKRLLPEGWVKEATTMRIMQKFEGEGTPPNPDWFQGYCYQMWRSRHNSYRADGAYGQFILVLPEQDAVIAITAHHGDGGIQMDQIWEYLLPALTGGASGKEWDDKLLEKIKTLHILE